MHIMYSDFNNYTKPCLTPVLVYCKLNNKQETVCNVVQSKMIDQQMCTDGFKVGLLKKNL